MSQSPTRLIMDYRCVRSASVLGSDHLFIRYTIQFSINRPSTDRCLRGLSASRTGLELSTCCGVVLRHPFAQSQGSCLVLVFLCCCVAAPSLSGALSCCQLPVFWESVRHKGH